jgi:protein-tyrosine phosphatase
VIQTLDLPDSTSPGAKTLQTALKILEEGGIVVFPTETVYGLAARADHTDALERLRAIKGRGADHPFTWHAPSAADAREGSPWPSLMGRLTQRYWPGPLTLVRPCPNPTTGRDLSQILQGEWLGVRVPAHQGTLALLKSAPFPIVATSANPSGSPAALNAEDAQAGLTSPPDLVLDGGPIGKGQDSSVLRVGPGQFELMREGLLSLTNLQQTAGLKIAMVCTGNTCRSPMAEGLTRSLLRETLRTNPESFGFKVMSMGVSAMDGMEPSEHSCVALAEQGLSLIEHRSQAATIERVMAMDRIYCMTRSHMQVLLSEMPAGQGPTVELLSPEGQDVPDPFGGSLKQYRQTRDAISVFLKQRLQDWV